MPENEKCIDPTQEYPFTPSGFPDITIYYVQPYGASESSSKLGFTNDYIRRYTVRTIGIAVPDKFLKSGKAQIHSESGLQVVHRSDLVYGITFDQLLRPEWANPLFMAITGKEKLTEAEERD